MKLIDVDMLCKYCDNNINHSITPNEIMRMPFVDAEPVKHGELWVSCSERMPETLTETLDGRHSDCCLVFAEETEWIGMAYYRTNNSESWWEFADAQNKPKIDWAEITHWMPLPNCPNCGYKMDGGAEDGKH